jgi:ABC-type Fe3+-siderophore transport system permease subunit
MATRSPIWLGVGYAVLVGAALVFALQPGGEGLKGVWAVVLALPWSVLIVLVFDAVNPRLTDQFGPVATFIGGLLNAYLLYFIASRSQRQDK